MYTATISCTTFVDGRDVAVSITREAETEGEITQFLDAMYHYATELTADKEADRDDD